jgi:hypothetical protein
VSSYAEEANGNGNATCPLPRLYEWVVGEKGAEADDGVRRVRFVEEAESVLPFVEGEGSSLALAPVVEVLEMGSAVWEAFWIWKELGLGGTWEAENETWRRLVDGGEVVVTLKRLVYAEV